jgi:4-amino-4-deoxy-L-arabinose transferase-like glycosyltransferase
MSVRARVLPILLGLAVIPYFVGLGSSSIWDANEAYYVETPREMIEGGDYVTPTFNYEPRVNKPVLTYWMVAGLYQLFGVSVSVQRAAIAALALLMIASAGLLARSASAAPGAALLAAIGLAANPRFFMFARRILIDVALAAIMTLILLCFALAERYPAQRRRLLAAMYVCVGLGVLAKGPVAAVLPAAAFLVYLAAHRELHRLKEMMIPLGVLIALAVAAPWYVALYADGGWTQISSFFIGENLERYTSLVGPQSRGALFYLPVVFTDGLPWSLCLPAVIVVWWRDRRAARVTPELRLRTLLLSWTAVIVVFFSFSQTKQDLYIFPIVAAVAALGGDLVARALRTRPGPEARLLRHSLVVAGGVLVAVGALAVAVFGRAEAVYVIDGSRIVSGLALAGGVAAAVLARRGRAGAAVIAVLVVLVAFNWTLVLRTLPSFERYKPVAPLSRTILAHAGGTDVIAHYDVALPSMVFYLRRHVEVMFDRQAFVGLMRSARRVFAVLPEHRFAELGPELGHAVCVLDRRPTFDAKLRSVLSLEPPPAVLLVANHCPP